jgi:hypothetical protein
MFAVEAVAAGNDWAETIWSFGTRVNSVEEAVALVKDSGYTVLADYPPEVSDIGFEDALISVFVSEEGLQ